MATVQVENIGKDKIPYLLDFCKSEGKFFTVGFYKRSNGEYREINCRGRVHKGLSGGSLPYNPDEHDLIAIYDIHDKHHKTIPVDSVIMVRAHGKEYRIG
jgi:hypothetical protein